MIRALPIVLFTSWLAALPLHAADDYADVRQALGQAMAEEDFPSALEHVGEALALRPSAPYLLGTRASVEARMGQDEAALATIEQLTELGVRVDVSAHPAFEGVRSLEDWPRAERRQAELDEPVGRAEVAARFDEPTFVPEGVAVDAQGRFYLGSIRHGHIVRVDGDSVETLVKAGTLGMGSVFGLRIDEAAGLLWVSTAVVPQAAEPDASRLGRSGILRFRLDTGEPVDAYWLPEDDAEHILGDLVLLDGHRAAATDSLGGAVVELDVRTGEFTELLSPGTLQSPQGLVLDEARGAWFLSDWAGGLFRMDVGGGAVDRIDGAPGTMLYGIDGLYLHDGDLVAVQNLAPPHRVTRIRLDEPGRSVTGQDTLLRAHPLFDEPTLGAIRDGVFYLNANSHWNRFDADNALTDPGTLSGPIVLRMPLSP